MGFLKYLLTFECISDDWFSRGGYVVSFFTGLILWGFAFVLLAAFASVIGSWFLLVPIAAMFYFSYQQYKEGKKDD